MGEVTAGQRQAGQPGAGEPEAGAGRAGGSLPVTFTAWKVYLVGGAVRDALLGLPVGERDWVVVGASPEDMEQLGYRAVGRDFPVFLHPETHEEYALARTERKGRAWLPRVSRSTARRTSRSKTTSAGAT